MHDEKPHFRKLAPITDGQDNNLMDAISDKVIRHLQKKGHLNENSEVVKNPASISQQSAARFATGR